MGKSDKGEHRASSGDHKSKKSDFDWNNANKVPLGRGGFFSTGKGAGAGSLLKPSYLQSTKDNDSSPVSNFGMSSNIGMMASSNVSRPNVSSFSGFSQMSSSNSNSQLGMQKVMSTDYSRLSEPQIGNSYYSGYGSQHFSSASSASSGSIKRENSDSNDSFDPFGNGGEGNDDQGRERKRKRRSRWMGSSDEKAVIPGMPTILPSDLPVDQQEAYIAQLQIEELTRKLRSGDLGIPPNPEDRSPSPEPIYGTDGKRLNTREYRTRKKLEEERHKLIQRLLKLNPDYKPPADYRAPIIKIVDRVPIPQEEHPEINFVGLLIGPRGNTLKGLEKDTGAKIIIRGKGSVKEGKVGGKAGHPLPGEDEPLHAYVTSNNPDSVKKACEKIKDIIRQGIDMPESQNDLRKNQLRELALLNGTLREGEGPKCSNCGATSHRTWHCPDKPNVTNSVICTVCGGAGHISRDCRLKRPGAGGPPVFNYNEKAKIDEEYMSLMAELGEAPPKEEPARIMRNRPATGGPNLFDKPSAPKAIAAPPPPQPPPPMMPPPVKTAPLPPSYPPPPGPPGYGSSYNPYMGGYPNYGPSFPPNIPPPPPKWLPGPSLPGPPPLPPGPPPQLSPPQPPGS